MLTDKDKILNKVWLPKYGVFGGIFAIDYYDHKIDYYAQTNKNDTDDMSGIIQSFNAPLSEVVIVRHTGQRDKNGKDIYVGDILENCDGIRFVVEEDNQGYFYIKTLNFFAEKFNETPLKFLNFILDCSEVIGNIYENKELLENGKK